MTDSSHPSRRPKRRSVSVALALGTAALAGCSPSHWLEEKKLGAVVFPSSIVPIMVFRSDYVRAHDRDGVTDAVASALASELGARGIQTTTVELAGEPRSPRIELAVVNLDSGGTVFPAITVDCAYVSPGEQVAYVGRLRIVAGETGIAAGVEPLARAIAEKLTSLT